MIRINDTDCDIIKWCLFKHGNPWAWEFTHDHT